MKILVDADRQRQTRTGAVNSSHHRPDHRPQSQRLSVTPRPPESTLPPVVPPEDRPFLIVNRDKLLLQAPLYSSTTAPAADIALQLPLCSSCSTAATIHLLLSRSGSRPPALQLLLHTSCSTAPDLQLLLFSCRATTPALQLPLYSSCSTAPALQPPRFQPLQLITVLRPRLPQEPLQAHVLQEPSQAHSLCSSPKSPCKHTSSAGALASN